MKVNFQVAQNYALTFQGRHIDLHNNFDFIHLEYSVQPMTLVLKWIKSSGDWVQKDELPYLALVHKNVSYLNVIPRDPEMPFTEDSCLSEITFFPSTSRAINDSITNKELPAEGDDVLYLFQSGQAIRVHCEEIELVID